MTVHSEHIGNTFGPNAPAIERSVSQEAARSASLPRFSPNDVYKPEHPVIQRVPPCRADDKVTTGLFEAIPYLVADRSCHRRRPSEDERSAGPKQLTREVVERRLLHIRLGIDDEITLTIGDQVLQVLRRGGDIADRHATLAKVRFDIRTGRVIADLINSDAMPTAVHDEQHRAAFVDADFIRNEPMK